MKSLKKWQQVLIIVFVFYALVSLALTQCEKREYVAEARMNLNVKTTGLQLVVVNLDSVDLTNVEMELNSDWSYKVNYLAAGATAKIGYLNFSDKKGNVFFGRKVLKLNVIAKRNGTLIAETYLFE